MSIFAYFTFSVKSNSQKYSKCIFVSCHPFLSELHTHFARLNDNYCLLFHEKLNYCCILHVFMLFVYIEKCHGRVIFHLSVQISLELLKAEVSGLLNRNFMYLGTKTLWFRNDHDRFTWLTYRFSLHLLDNFIGGRHLTGNETYWLIYEKLITAANTNF